MIGLLWIPCSAQAQVVCDGGATHASLGQALDDPACLELRLPAGVHYEEVVVRRPVSITGSGADATWLVCDDGPCLAVLPGVTFELRGLTVASEGTTLAAWQAQVEVEDVVVTHLGPRGGRVSLRNTNGRFSRIDVDVSPQNAPIQIEALSTRGHDVAFHTARFFGQEPESGTKAAIYTIGYSVDCKHCSFWHERERLKPPEPLFDLDDGPVSTSPAQSRVARWPQLACPAASAPDREQCRAQCSDDDEVATCRMVWDDTTTACHPVAVCVPTGEAIDATTLPGGEGATR